MPTPPRVTKPATRKRLTAELAAMAPALHNHTELFRALADELKVALPYDEAAQHYACQGCRALAERVAALDACVQSLTRQAHRHFWMPGGEPDGE